MVNRRLSSRAYFKQFSLLICISFGILGYAFLGAAVAADTKLLEQLKDGQHVLFIRHAYAPGYGDPEGFRLDQCETQRNLNEQGRQQARGIGKWLTKEGILRAQVFSSPWCRCLETAKLLQKGEPAAIPELGSFFNQMSQAKTRTRELEKWLQSRQAESLNSNPKKREHLPIILVTHHVNIEAFTGKVVSVGDAVLVKLNRDGQYVSHVVYPSPSF